MVEELDEFLGKTVEESSLKLGDFFIREQYSMKREKIVIALFKLISMASRR